jgi:sugar lactone lactonase YvrE
MCRKSLCILFFTFLQIMGFEAVSQCTPPPAPSAVNATICSNAIVSLSASGTGTLSWYDAATNGNWLGSGTTFTTPVLTNTTTYYVQDSTCASSASRKMVTVTVNALPVAGFSIPSLVCTGAPVKFNSLSTCGSNPAISFSGSSSASRSLISLATDNITMEIWARWSGAANGNQILFYNGHTGNGGYGILMNPSGNLQILVGGLSYLVSSANITAGIWQHVAIVRSSGTWSLYLDGIQYSVSPNTTNPRAPNVAGGNQLSIGYAQDGGQRYYGDLDEAKFWTVARNISQIQSDMNSCSTGATAGLLAYWSFNEGIGSTAADGSGNGYSLSLNSTSWLSAGASTGTATYAWDFGDGTSASVRNNVRTYSASGTRTVSLTVTGANNCSATFSSPVVVNQSPTASISGTATNCNLVTLAAGGGGTYAWSGGNSTNTAINTFNSSGTYTVTVTNLAGCTATSSQAVVVNALPAAAVNGPLPTISTFVSGLSSPKGLAFDTSGNLFIAEQSGDRIRKVTSGGSASIFNSTLFSPQGLFVDKSGNVYVSSFNDIKKIGPDASLIDTYTPFSSPYGLHVEDGSGKIYFAERNTGSIKMIDGGVVTTFVSGLTSPAGIAFDTSGNLYVAEQISSGTVKKISSTGTISTFATGLSSPYGLAFDGSGNLFVAESSITRSIVKITPDGTKTTYIILNNNPQYLAFDKAGNLYVSNSNVINKVVPAVTNETTVIDSGYVTLIATPGTGVTIDWYDQPSNGTLILAGNTNYTTPVVANTTHYYAEARNTTTGCISLSRTAVPVTVIYNTLNKNGKTSMDSGNKISKDGAVGGTGVTKNGRIIH